MVRSAAAVVALLALPALALAQESQGSHTVVNDDTLWDLAQRYYSDPFEWRTIWEANRGVVEDPNWIYPDEILVIPGASADAVATQPIAAIEPGAPSTTTGQPAAQQNASGGVPAELVPFGLREARPQPQNARTIFYQQGPRDTGGVMAAVERDYVPVSEDRVYSAPWMIRLAEEPTSTGVVTSFDRPGNEGTTVRSFDRIRIDMDSPARVGARLQLFKVDRTIAEVGKVVVPTGVATVEAIGDGHVVATLVKEYHMAELGDLVRPLPEYTARPGVYAQAVSGGAEAMIMGFAGNHALTDVGHVAFLDLGSEDGIVIGDEFVLFGESLPGDNQGALQVIAVTESMASARVVSMSDDVFRQGVVVRLAKKMR